MTQNSAKSRVQRPFLVSDDKKFLDISAKSIQLLEPIGSHEAFSAAITDGSLDLTVEGANTIQLSLHDKSRTLLKNIGARTLKPLKGDPNTVFMTNLKIYRNKIEDAKTGLLVAYEVCKIEKQGDSLEITFEDDVVWKLRYTDGKNVAAKANRDNMTRAQFIGYLVRGQGIGFVCPEENIKQNVAAVAVSASEQAKRAPGFNKEASVKVKGKKASKQQISNLAVICAVGVQKKMPKDMVIAAIAAATQESDVSNHPPGGNAAHLGMFQMDSAKGTEKQRKDPAFAVGWFYNTGYPIWKANQSPSDPGDKITPAEIAYKVEKPPPYPAGGGEAQYAQWEVEAGETYALYNGVKAGRNITDVTHYEFSVQTNETHWDAIQRLASEVNWRAFVVDGVIYYMSEDYMFKQKPSLTISEALSWVDSIDFAIDNSPRGDTKLTVTAHAAKWSAQQGEVVVVEDLGPADGRWLVHEISRSLFSDLTTITLSKPTPKKKEPAPSTTAANADTGLDVSDLNKMYTLATTLDKKNYPYVFGGGHAKLGLADAGVYKGQVGSPQTKGFDCSGAVSALLGKIGVVASPMGTGGLKSIGEAGKGKHFTMYVADGANLPGGGHVYVEFNTPNGGKQRWAAESSTGVGFKTASQLPPARPYVARRIPGL